MENIITDVPHMNVKIEIGITDPEKCFLPEIAEVYTLRRYVYPAAVLLDIALAADHPQYSVSKMGGRIILGDTESISK